MCVRERDCAPVPHDLVHVVQAPKVATWQSAGHVCALHARVSAECGHAAPPFTGAAFVRERLCAPAPHDLVHVVHTLKLPSTQSTGQPCALQLRVSAECGHTTPPQRGCVVARDRDCIPVPHDLVHVVHAPNAVCVQSCGHW